MAHGWGIVLALLALVAYASPARAERRFPASTGVVFDPHDGKTVYVRTTFGLVATHDGGSSWRSICERAMGVTSDEDPSYVVTPKGTLVVGARGGIAVSRDGGCNFTFAGGKGAYVLTDLATRPDGEIVAVLGLPPQLPRGVGFADSSPVSSVAGMAGADNHLVSSKDDAQSFSIGGGPIDSGLRIGSMKVAASDPARLYLSAVRGEGDPPKGALLVSYDAGMTWTERKLDLLPGETSSVIGGVDPTHPDRVYVRTVGSIDAHTRLLATDDGGRTWRKAFDASSPLLGFAMADDGSRVYVGAREGVSFAAADNLEFGKGSSTESQCLAASGSALWSCSTEKSGFLVGASRSGGKAFDAKLHLDDVKGPLECAPESTVGKECVADWPKLREELGLPDPSEQTRAKGPSGPALRGRAVRTSRAASPIRTAAGILLVGLIAYFALQRLRRGRG